MLRILARVALIPTLLIVGTISLSLLSTSVVRGAINNQISFQGKLTNPDGTNVTNGNYSIAFTIYSGGTVNGGGTSVWTETQNPVTVTDGIFQVNLGSVTSLPGSVDFNASDLFLAVKVGADPEMLPRITFTASPYAFNSDKLGGIAASGFVQLSPGSQQTGFINISGNTTVGGTYNGNTFTSSALTFSAASTATIQSAGSQAMNITGNAASTYSTSTGNLTIQAGSGTVSLGTSTALTASGTLALSSGAATALTIDSGTTGALNIGTGANAKTITIGNTTGATAIATLVGGSTNAFSIQGASSVVYLQLNTTNERLYVGNPAGEAGTSIVLLVLNNKTDAGDPTNGVNGAQYYNVTSKEFRCYRDNAWKDCDNSYNTVRVTADRQNATTAYTDVTDLTWAVVANTNYEYECSMIVDVAAAATGAQFSVNGPAAFTQLVATFDVSSSTTAVSKYSHVAYNSATNVPTASQGPIRTIYKASGNFVNGNNAGTFAIRFRSENTNAVNVRQGSWCQYRTY